MSMPEGLAAAKLWVMNLSEMYGRSFIFVFSYIIFLFIVLLYFIWIMHVGWNPDRQQEIMLSRRDDQT